MSGKRILFTALMLVLSLSFAAQAKKQAVLSLGKGELPDDVANCEVTLSEDNVEKTGDFSMLLKFTKKGGWAGVDKPKKGGRDKFKAIHFNIFNPSDKPVETLSFMVKGAKMTNTPENRKDWSLSLKPGKNEVKIDLGGQICNDGKTPLDLTRLLRWALWGNSDEPEMIVYIQKIWLED